MYLVTLQVSRIGFRIYVYFIYVLSLVSPLLARNYMLLPGLPVSVL